MSTSPSLKIRVTVDQKAALLAGRILGATVEVEVSPSGIGDLWPTLVGQLDVGENPPSLGGVSVEDATEAAVVAALAAKVKAKQQAEEAQAERVRAEVAQIEGQLAVYEAALANPMTIEDCYHPNVRDGRGAKYAGCVRRMPALPWTRIANDTPQPIRALLERAEALRVANEAAIKAANEAAWAEQKERVLAEIDAKIAAEKAEEEAKKTAKAEELRLRIAERLATGYWERKTESYNERRYGAYWCAAVSFPDGPKAEYSWGESSANGGSAGVLRVPCRPGDIIAWGQKDKRKRNSEHHLLIMQDDGRMVEVDKAAAWGHWKSHSKGAVKKA